jgi:hypothetical protein
VAIARVTVVAPSIWTLQDFDDRPRRIPQCLVSTPSPF